MKHALLAALCLTALAACKEDDLAAVPSPVRMTTDALGHYCQMNLTEHPGPKAQVHLKGIAAPIYFAQVRDAIAYQRMPEQSHAISVVYVNDMSIAPSWDAPGDDNWIAAESAVFVVGSDMVGGMGAAELVPFSDSASAAAFAERHGGRVVALDAVEDVDVLTPEQDAPVVADDQDFSARLSRLANEGNR